MGYVGNQYLKTQDKKALGPVSGQTQGFLYPHHHPNGNPAALGHPFNTHHGVKETVVLGLTEGTSVGSDAWLQS